MKRAVQSAVLSIALGLGAAPAALQALPVSEAAAGREVVKQSANSIIGIEMVVTLKLTMGDRAMPPRENKIDVNGTVLNAAGLTVTSLAAIDPRTQFETMRMAMGPMGARMEVSETDFKEVKLRLADGTEVPARVVLKDADLDLAFIAPEVDPNAPKRVFSPVKLDHPAEGVVLETYFVVSRAAKTLRRVPVVRPTLVVGVVEKPRRLFLMSEQQLGCPVFDQSGRVLGISLHNLSNGRTSGIVVLPAEDVAESAKQAAVEAAKPPPPPVPKAAPASPAPEKKSAPPLPPEPPAKK